METQSKIIGGSFLRDVDPDVIKPLVPLSNELVEKFENFLSPLTIEEFREDNNSKLGTGVRHTHFPRQCQP